MRCPYCAWIVGEEACPCGETQPGQPDIVVPVGTRVIARPGRGPSMSLIWLEGEVVGHQGLLHRVKTGAGQCWCECDDVLGGAAEREPKLKRGSRVWALWMDNRWYTGRVDGAQGTVRHVTWDDGDSMWLEATHLVPLVLEARPPQIDNVVMAPRWDGEVQPARVEGQVGNEFRVVFGDGEEATVPADQLATFPPNPFVE